MNVEENLHQTYMRAVHSMDLAILSEEPDSRRAQLSKALNYAMTCVAAKSSDAEYNYLVGLIYTRMAEESKGLSDQAITYLEVAIGFDPGHQLALYCLLCINFNRKRYLEALKCFERVDWEKFVIMGQEWRILKGKELGCCCLLLLGMQSQALDLLKEVCRLYVSFDKISAPIPMELLIAANVLLMSGDLAKETEKSLLEIVNKIVSQMDLREFVFERFPALLERLEN